MVSNIARQYGPREPSYFIEGIGRHLIRGTVPKEISIRKRVQRRHQVMFDATSGYWYNILGMNNKELMKVKREVGGIPFHLYDEYTHQYAEDLANTLCIRVGLSGPWQGITIQGIPGGPVYNSHWKSPQKVIFANSGSGACENARKEAANYFVAQGWEEEELLFAAIEGSYHGSFGPMLKWINPERNPVMVECPLYRQESKLESLVERWIQKVRKVEKFGKKKVAGFFYEPVMGVRGAVKLPYRNYLQPILDFCRRREILVIADEVSTGLGRTGHFYAHSGADMVCLGKGLSAGYYPLAVTLVSKEIASCWDSLSDRIFNERGNSMAGTPEACAIGDKVIEILDREDYYNSNRELGQFALSRLEQCLKEVPGVREIRGEGLLIAVDVHDSRLAQEAKVKMRYECINFIPEGRMIMFCPAYNVSKNEITLFAEKLGWVLKKIHK